MPKIVDHIERKNSIAEAVWRIVRREGLDGVTVRRVADEMDFSVGSLRHYFDSQDELLSYSMRLLAQRVKERIQALPVGSDPLRNIAMMIEELVPLDEQRIAESEVWLAFAAKGISVPSIRALSREAHDQLYEGFRGMIEHLAAGGRTKDGLEPEVEIRRLHALIDGLAVHYTLYPEEANRVELMRIVSCHLNGLLRNDEGR